MRVSRERAAESRERILAAAARRFRERGFDGIGLAELMKDAGLTHGGFYGHFDSKEDLMARACARAMEGSLAKWTRLAEGAEGDPIAAIAADYLTAGHRDAAGAGCLMAALSQDVSRQPGPVRRAFTEGLRALASVLSRRTPGRPDVAPAARDEALADLATLVGAVTLARAVDDPDLSDRILRAASSALTGHRRQEA